MAEKKTTFVGEIDGQPIQAVGPVTFPGDGKPYSTSDAEEIRILREAGIEEVSQREAR